MARVRHYLKLVFLKTFNMEVYLSEENRTLPKASPSVFHSGLQKAKIHFPSQDYQASIINP